MVRAAPARHEKKAEQEKATLVWVDEGGFYLLPMAVRTWAPRGQTPVLRVPLTHDHLSSISGITLDGRLLLQVRPASSDAVGVVSFLRVLMPKMSGQLVVIWDGSPIHRGQPIKDFLKRGAAKRLHLEQLPGYAPDLNPDEGIWNSLKRVELGNMSVVAILISCSANEFALESACDTNRRSSKAAIVNVAIRFSSLARGQ